MQVIDQMLRVVELSDTPKRIVSLVPSQTELLFHLGLEESIVGRTKFCVHPKKKVKKKRVIGGTKNFRFDEIEKLHPDLIIGNKEENYQEGIEKLAQKYPVWMSDIVTLEDSLQMIRSLGEITAKTTVSEALIRDIRIEFENLKEISASVPARKVVYLIWKEPFICVGKQTFINEMLKYCGFENVFEGLNRYPEISSETLQSAHPELIMLSSEPYPFKAKHQPELKKLCPNAQILLVDGEMFSWYGSRMLKASAYFKILLKQINRVAKF